MQISPFWMHVHSSKFLCNFTSDLALHIYHVRSIFWEVNVIVLVTYCILWTIVCNLKVSSFIGFLCGNRFSELLHIFMGLESATGTSNLKIFWCVFKFLCLCTHYDLMMFTHIICCCRSMHTLISSNSVILEVPKFW